MQKWVLGLGLLAACAADEPAANNAAPAKSGVTVTDALEATEGTEVVTLQIDGMVCGGCADAATEALRGMDGVVDASVSFDTRTATVTCDPAKVDRDGLVATLENVVMGGKKMPFEVTVTE